jgi:sec-independent protein translocase protein TatA
MRLGFGEMLVVLVIALLVFGPSKLPQLGDALGKSIRNFKKAAEGLDSDAASQPRAEQAKLAPASSEARTTAPGETGKA